MKNLSLILVCFLTFTLLKAQDVGISGSFNPSTVAVGQTSVLTVNFGQNAFISYPIGEVWVQVTFPQAFYDCNATPTGDFMTYFSDFNDDDNDGIWFGYNTAPIPALLSGGFVGATLNMVVTGIAPIGTNSSTLFATDFDSFTELSSTTGDNLSDAGMIVTAPLPIKLVSFDGRSSSCDQIDLTWQTTSERNNEYIEVQRSSNGIDFVTLDKLSGTNRSDLNSYAYYDRSELITGNKYYYRLKQVDFDGKFEYHRVIAVEHTCAGEKLALNIYPNPAIDKVSITLDGLKVPTDLTLSVLNNEGSLVRTLSINSAVINEYILSDLPAGVYHLRTEGLDQALTVKFIRIQ